jgi:hypothetical protein
MTLARVAIALLLLSTSCSSITGGKERPIPRRVLFIGNSLTSENSLPALVRSLARAAGMPELTIGEELGDDMNLLDHWVGAAPALIDKGWDVVIMQQGPTSTASGRVELRMMAQRFAERIRATGGQPAFYMVWPAASNASGYADVSRSYRLAAEDVNGYLFPAGEAWLEAWRHDIAMPLYGGDGLHPSAYGTYLAALTIFVGLYDRSSVGLPSRLTLDDGRGTTIWVNPSDAQILQAAADAASRRFGRAP